MAIADTRFDQIFPVLDPAQIESAKRFASGPPRTFAAGEVAYDVGERNAPSWLVLDGSMEVLRSDGLHRQSSVISLNPGQFSGEIGQLSGTGTLAQVKGGSEGSVALPFDPAHIRALVIGSADIGEILMRAFILRRTAFIQEGGAGSVLIGRRGMPDLIRLEGFLARNAYPYTTLDAATDAEARAAIERFSVRDDELPLMICPSGEFLKRPSEAEVGACLGITPELDCVTTYDVAIVGGGPAGLAAAVYGASEGLSVIVLDQRAFGGQAGASARIENYLGFPTGISGQALAGRAFAQAQKFGAKIAIPIDVRRLDCGERRPGDPVRVEIGDGKAVMARSVVIASGVRYRRPAIPNLAEFDNAGISYWASPIEAKLCEGEEVALIGGGNSAGQAVVFLAPKVRRLHLVVRGKGLEASMSRYLIDRIKALPNVELHVDTEIVALEGSRAAGLSGAVFRNGADGSTKTCLVHHLFLFIGADPNTDWLDNCVEVDSKGFVLTGDALGIRPSSRPRQPLETSIPGVFAIGDVRANSTKRVGAAIGEGAAVVAQIHGMLAATAR